MCEANRNLYCSHNSHSDTDCLEQVALIQALNFSLVYVRNSGVMRAAQNTGFTLLVLAVVFLAAWWPVILALLVYYEWLSADAMSGRKVHSCLWIPMTRAHVGIGRNDQKAAHWGRWSCSYFRTVVALTYYCDAELSRMGPYSCYWEAAALG